MDNKIKRKRSSNFSVSEVNILINMVSTFKDIIENKKTDAVTNAEKEAAWNRITLSFNAVSGEVNRSAKTLKLKYEGLKKNAKKKVSDNQEMYITGGGEPNQIPYTGAEEKVIAICSNIKSMAERKDSDNIITDSKFAIQLDEEENDAVVLKNRSKALGCEVTQEGERELNPMIPNMALKNKVSPALNKGISKKTATTRLDELTSARLELIKLQQELAKKEFEIKVREHEQKSKEHELRVLGLINDERRKQEEHVLKINKLNN